MGMAAAGHAVDPLAAAGLGTLRPLATVYRMKDRPPLVLGGSAPSVRTDDTDGCPAFYAQAVLGLTNTASHRGCSRG